MSSLPISSLRLLNLGCGNTIDHRWVNLDVKSNHPAVIEHDLNKGIPFSNGEFDAVYLSHVLEHFSPDNGQRLIKECRRVTKSQGVIRVAVPDLEKICKDYLAALEDAAAGSRGAKLTRDWMAVELLDQLVREKSGGVMAEYLASPPPEIEAFIRTRVGNSALDGLKVPAAHVSKLPRRCLKNVLTIQVVLRKLRSARWHLQKLFLRLLLGKSGSACFDLGYFRRLGEVHLWMYDRVSLADILLKSGFVNPQQRTANDSTIPGWKIYLLDFDEAGKPRKPDSIYMEADCP